MKLLLACKGASLVKSRSVCSLLPRPPSKVNHVNRMASTKTTGPVASAIETAEADTAQGRSVEDPHPWHERFDITEDRQVYKRYLTVYDRVVTFTPNDGESHAVHYDVVGHPTASYLFAVAIPFHRATGERPAQVTVIREYAQGPNRLMYCFPSGGFDRRKHADLRECAQAEMAEESMLVGGQVVALLPEDHPGQSELKWSRNTFKPFLFIDPQPAPTGHAAVRDAEEHTIEVLRITISELRRLIAEGQVMLPSVYAFFLAQDILTDRQLL